MLGTGSLPLDLGRGNRLFSEAQRLALAPLYEHTVVTDARGRKTIHLARRR